jgi:hypothetical protein
MSGSPLTADASLRRNELVKWAISDHQPWKRSASKTPQAKRLEPATPRYRALSSAWSLCRAPPAPPGRGSVGEG